MKRVFQSMTAILAFTAAVQTAVAADLPRRAPDYPVKAQPLRAFDWTGFYVGVNGGYGWGDSSYNFGAAGINTFDVKGGLVGGTVGYNYQFGQTVFGIEGDFDWQDVKGSATCVAGVCRTKSDWLGTVRGRLGYAIDRFMPYVTGGAAFADVKETIPGLSQSNTRTGWTAGGGAEYAIAPNWTVKAEYLYVDLGKFSCGVCGTTNVKFNENVVRAGLNYKF